MKPFERIKQGLEDSIAFSRGERILKVTDTNLEKLVTIKRHVNRFQKDKITGEELATLIELEMTDEIDDRAEKAESDG